MIKHVLEICVVLAMSMSPNTQQGATPCSERKEMQLLAFWTGSWDVFAGSQKIGSNVIEWILDSCAIAEHWSDAKGREGKSLFYYYTPEQTWKQVWVTDNPFWPGGVKEKVHTETMPDGSVRFLGKLPDASGKIYWDRTSLKPLENGDVSQLIERSDDQGATWRNVFQAVYRRSR